MERQNKKTSSEKKGFSLFFAVVTGGILLMMTMAVISTITREIILSSISRDSMKAFYSADTGIECVAKAIFKDEVVAKWIFDGTGSIIGKSVSCANNNFPIISSAVDLGICPSGFTWRRGFIIDNKNNPGDNGFFYTALTARCSDGSVEKTFIVSKGYNVSADNTIRAVERSVEISND